MTSNHEKKSTTPHKPKMLKEFLQEINTPSHSSSNHTIPKTRSSKSRATLLSFNKLINKTVKSLSRYASSSSPPLTLSKSLSKSLLDRFSSKKKNKSKSNMIKVRDILRWRSFRDILFVEGPTPCDDSNSESDVIFWDDDDSNNSHTSSSSESKFCSIMDELPCWWGNFIDQGKNWDQTNDDVVATVSHLEHKEDNHTMAMEDEKEQHSPVSVLNSPFEDEISDQEFDSSFNKSLANMERNKQSLLQSIQWLESLAGVCVSKEEYDETEEVQDDEELRKECSAIKAKTMSNLSRAIRKVTKERQCLEDKIACIKDMENQGQWSNFIEDKGELGVELEVQFLSDLVNEVVDDLFR